MKLAVFVSGSGSLLGSFARLAAKKNDLELVVVADRYCEAIAVAQGLGIEVIDFDRFDEDVDGICLAGFLKILDNDFLNKYEGKIVNAHPSLLPKYGGKGFYGDKVHEAVLATGDKETGFTIHKVTAEIDAGEIISQKKCPVYDEDTVEDVRKRVQDLEKEHYASSAISYFSTVR
jgi:phosphoribosylglycinamide formyltransferase-1